MNKKKFLSRLAQGVILVALMYTIWGTFALGYDVVLVNAHAGLFIVFTGATTASVLALGVSVINDSIKGE